ncbi:hypothetical protein RS130_16870 [Paraglaciecola aquimarina]|uniref:Uncharacterized protein n=1 Tax=Paraglaciecola aquimarina TaxID=1235557 RepID=A0ABU3SZD6_9ALTE|nr:hypothetical protein [Paraglaciecola aquimarina]MDU0355355.1 hypothetical protein [Paraglaciecola aquimarina]
MILRSPLIFHEFTFGLQTDDAGNFYFSKASPVKQGGRGFDSTHDNHGVVMKVSADGKNSEVVLSGLRAAGGLSVSPDGSIITTGENEGTYVQACKVNYAKQGDFMGVIHHEMAELCNKAIPNHSRTYLCKQTILVVDRYGCQKELGGI